jgi:hypothetical protein
MISSRMANTTGKPSSPPHRPPGTVRAAALSGPPKSRAAIPFTITCIDLMKIFLAHESSLACGDLPRASNGKLFTCSRRNLKRW